MTQEEKKLLLIDLCGRLPYKIKVNVGSILTVYSIIDFNKVYLKVDDEALRGWSEEVEKIKPYLRPMSSMTEEEKEDLKKEHLKDEKLYAECLANAANGDSSMRGKVIPHFAADWCNKYGFDYRGLIPMGLALEAPEDMYKTE